MHRNWIIILFIISATGLHAQHSSIHATVDKNRILLGEPFQLTIEAHYPLTSLRILEIDSIPHFEMTEAPLVDSTVERDWVTIKKIYKLTSFDSGRWMIPSYAITGRVGSDSIAVDVTYTEDFDPNKDYNPIRDIIDVEVKKQIPWWWYATGAGVLVLAVIIYLLLKKRKKGPPVKVEARDAYQQAMMELEQLRQQKPETKTYYSKLSEIFRLYLSRRKGIHSLQKTTDDLLIQMRSLPLEKEGLDRASQVLRLSDFVKFARYQPAREDDEQSFLVIRETIDSIERSVEKTIEP